MDLLFFLSAFLLLLLAGLLVGTVLERQHFRSIEEREARLRHIPVFADRQPPPHFNGAFGLVSGSVVIASDYFKTIAAMLKGIIGGRLGSYETLIERGRREAILRMKEAAAREGAQAIFNVRLETSTLNQNKRQGIVCAEILAYGTAFKTSPHAEGGQ
jgi:uncharacterized protein YbjQ (UPF0145 family)